MDVRSRLRLLAVIMTGIPLVLTGCTGSPAKESARPATSAPSPPPTLSITPATNTTDVPISAEIGTTVSGGKITSVALTDAAGGVVNGAMRTDGTSWVPNKPLNHKQAYTAHVTATNDSGATTVQTTSFTTMAEPAKRATTTLYLRDKATFGVAMPVVVDFETAVPEKDRANVQRRLFVRTDPPQPGVWHWLADGSQVYYRAPDYWRPGTTISVRAALGGHPLGGGRYGDTDRTATAKIGDEVTLDVNNSTKKISVYQDGKLTRTIPVSLGKARTPTSSGTMVIMEKAASTVFDTFAELGPAEGYRVRVDYAQRLTWGGEFIHSAPWSVGDQGRRNVSHGCLNVSPANARWLFEITKVGDPVTIHNTEVDLASGNGWTAWNMTWEEYIKGSALPVPANLQPTPSAQPSGSPPVAGAPATTSPSPGR